ncbi:MAG: GNAT family N-acetyltransferase [Kiritimatiellae bacterium]|nr:GNAT family N-acetyltransferase [Kiritimatiellia bacterium]
MRITKPTRKLLDAYLRMRDATLSTCAEKYILPADPFAPPPSWFVPSEWRWAVDGGDVVGVLNVRKRLNRDLREWGGHVGVAVSATRRRAGIGTALFKRGVEMARRFAPGGVVVTVETDNLASLRMVSSVALAERWTASARLGKVAARGVWRIRIGAEEEAEKER